MNLGNAGNWAIALLSVIGIGNIALFLVRWKLGGKRQSDVSATTELTGTALRLVKGVETQLNEAKAEAKAARTEAENCRAEVRKLTERLDHLDEVMAREASWAAKARDALVDNWPEGLNRRPPIFEAVPEQ